MKKKLLSFILILFIAVLSVKGQNYTYFSEGFETVVVGGATSNTTPTKATTTSGEWTFYFTGPSTSTSFLCPTVGGSKSLRMIDSTEIPTRLATATGRAYVISPKLDFGVNTVSFIEQRGRPISVWYSTDDGATFIFGGLVNTSSCVTQTVTINNQNANRIKIRLDHNTSDADLDNVTITSTAAILPLNFLSFNAKLTEGFSKQAKLAWTTTNEVNTKSFIVERGLNETFSAIGEVDSKNTSGEHNYSFTDAAPASGLNYYRLKQVDKDGAFKYSKIVSVENKSAISLSVYPNPASGSTLTVSHPSADRNASLKIITVQGRQVASATVSAGSISSSLDVSRLAAGYYLAVFESGSEKSSVKFVKQ